MRVRPGPVDIAETITAVAASTAFCLPGTWKFDPKGTTQKGRNVSAKFGINTKRIRGGTHGGKWKRFIFRASFRAFYK